MREEDGREEEEEEEETVDYEGKHSLWDLAGEGEMGRGGGGGSGSHRVPTVRLERVRGAEWCPRCRKRSVELG